MIKGISHLAFNVTNMEKALHFYQDILGFEKAFTIDDDNGNPWIVYLKVKPYQFIELFYSNEKEFNKDKLSYSHLCLEVDDINVIANHLKKTALNLMLNLFKVKIKTINAGAKTMMAIKLSLCSYIMNLCKLKYQNKKSEIRLF